ncbi:Metacaspase-1 [Camellia lanceoleosa]|uniref:Metacaspase-1 n=1 Tax=Camellia lanceoleosa TaxID=1840588 RepID=A0ACC0IL77_9ERIC|nr:Metacaspase-1 [Camellia lanceoleosa]
MTNNIGVHLPKRAVLCGVSYQKKKHKLKGTINDVNRMKSLLTDHFGFLETSICVLTEDEDDPNLIPTKENMQKALRWLVADCKSGDSLVFYFSGHGLRQPDFDMDEIDGYNETICPFDFMTAGMILDNDINNTIVKPLKEGVKLHAIIDACHSGTILDLDHVYDRKQKLWVDNKPTSSVRKSTSGGLAISLSTCADGQMAADTTAFSRNKMTGAMTYIFDQIIRQNPRITYEEEDDPNLIPTKENIQKALRWLVADCKSGDSLVFYFSGHGLRQPDFDMDENDDYDQTICPSDFMTARMILANDINNTIVKPLKEGVKLHAIIDACHSGTILDLDHVYDIKQSSEELPGQAALLKCTESPSPDELPPRITKMDALIQIAQSSILETSTAEPNDQTNDGSSPNTQKVATVPETHAANSDHKLSSNSGPNELENEDCMTTRAPDLVEKHGNSEQEIGFGNSQLTPIHDVVTGTSGQIVEENVCQSGVADSSMPVVQSLPCFPLLTTISNKGENEFCTVDQKLDNVTAFDDLRLDEIEPLKFNFVNGQESPSLPEVTMNLANDEGMEEGFNSSAGFETEAVMLNIAGRLQFTTMCVWCRTEFNHEAVDSETQSDSVGFMCPTYKAKISGQLNVLDSGLSMNSHL